MRIFIYFYFACLTWYLDFALAFSSAVTKDSWRTPTLKTYNHPSKSRAHKAAPGSGSTILCSTFNSDAYNDDNKSPESHSYLQGKWSDFIYGADYVHSRYLQLFWEYNFQRTIVPWVLPFSLLLAGTQFISPNAGSMTFDVLKYICTGIFLAASALGGLLSLPFDALRWTITLTPAIVIPMFDYLPSNAAMQVVSILLDMHSSLNFLAQTTLVTGIAAVFWRPMIEEIQYRYLLSKLVGKGKNSNLQPKINDNSESASLVRFIPVNASSKNEKIQNKPSAATTTKRQSVSKSKSRRQFFCSLAFACTRLGWLCAHPETVDPSLPFLQTAISPYSWTVAFLQSVLATFSSRVASELSPLVQRSLLLLAIQQTVSTFFVTWHVFIPLYEERGIAASIGAHIAWTFGKMTWPIRLLWRAMTKVSDAKNIELSSSLETFLNRKR